MILKPTEKTIDGLAFTVTQFPAMRALILKARLAKVLAPGLAEILSLFGGKMPEGKALDIDAAALAPAFSALAMKLEPAEFAGLCKDLFGTTFVVLEGTKFDLDSTEKMDHVFTGRLETLYKGLFLVLQVNDFFGFGGIGKALSRKMAQEAKPPAENSTKI
jgi:hypothetical protein